MSLRNNLFRKSGNGKQKGASRSKGKVSPKRYECKKENVNDVNYKERYQNEKETHKCRVMKRKVP